MLFTAFKIEYDLDAVATTVTIEDEDVVELVAQTVRSCLPGPLLIPGSQAPLLDAVKKIVGLKWFKTRKPS